MVLSVCETYVLTCTYPYYTIRSIKQRARPKTSHSWKEYPTMTDQRKPSVSKAMVSLAVMLLVTGTFVSVQAEVELSLLSNVYLPSGTEGAPQYGAVPVTSAAYSPGEKLVYVAGKNLLQVIDVSKASTAKVIESRFEPTKDFSDVVVCANRLFVAVSDQRKPDQGQLRVYSLYRSGLQLQYVAEVGGNTGKMAVIGDCNTAVIALPGKPYKNIAGETEDPTGEILVATFPSGPLTNGSGNIARINSCSFNSRYEALARSGVRFESRGAGGVFSKDVEPTDVVIDESPLGDTAYVTLQENNAFAEIDLTTRTLTTIHGLGSKKWGSLDTSDGDSGARVSDWPIRSWFQPSGINLHQWRGMTLIFTANQGSSRPSEVTRNITAADLSDDLPGILKTGIEDESKLGRLLLSSKDGKDPTSGKYKNLYTFGGRSFSVWGMSWGLLQRMFDSGSQIEELTAQRCPHLFNRAAKVDDRSDDMGPEPESITVGEIQGRLYIFIGVKYPGTIFVYSLGTNPSKPRFETIFCDGIPNDARSFQKMFDDRKYYGADPRDIRFIPAKQSPTGQPVLMVAGRASGTVTLLEVKVVNKE